jgi:hypothetical protein
VNLRTIGSSAADPIGNPGHRRAESIISGVTLGADCVVIEPRLLHNRNNSGEWSAAPNVCSMKSVHPGMRLKEITPITISVLHGRQLSGRASQTGTVLLEVPTSMLLNGGYGYGWF